MNEYQRNKYKILRKAIPPELAKFCYTYFLNKRKVATFLLEHKWLSPFATEWGVWNDGQVPNTYSHYGDMVMETLLQGLRVKMEQETGYKLQEAYSYARIYKTGDVLPRHKDRYSCEVSTTLNLGGDPWSVYLEPNKNVCIPTDIFVPTKNKGIKVDLKPGDMLLYSGCEVEHWREAFLGKNCGQVFLHYNDTAKKTAKENIYDQRPFPGLPRWFKGFKFPSQKK